MPTACCTGSEVLTAGGLSEAMVLLGSHCFDAVITDLSLEGTRGLEGLEVARSAKTRNPGVKVILVTAYGGDEIGEQVAECGVDLELAKPVSLALLRQVLTDFGLSG